MVFFFFKWVFFRHYVVLFGELFIYLYIYQASQRCSESFEEKVAAQEP